MRKSKQYTHIYIYTHGHACVCALYMYFSNIIHMARCSSVISSSSSASRTTSSSPSSFSLPLPLFAHSVVWSAHALNVTCVICNVFVSLNSLSGMVGALTHSLTHTLTLALSYSPTCWCSNKLSHIPALYIALACALLVFATAASVVPQLRFGGWFLRSQKQ